MDPLISVVVPIYKVERYLHKCIDSILNQEYRRLEIILVDDGSPDNCPKICDEYAKMDKRIKVVHKQNGGLSDARNAGLDQMSGEYVAFIDSDDYVDMNYIQAMYDLILQYHTKMSVLPIRMEYENGSAFSTIKQKIPVCKLSAEQLLEDIMYQWHFETNAFCKLYHKSLFEQIRYPKGELYEDLSTTYKLIDKCVEGIACSCDHMPYHYIQHSDSIMNSRISRKKLILIEISQDLLDFISQKYPKIKPAVIRRYVYSNFYLLDRSYMYPEYQNEVKQMKRNVLRYRNSILKNPKIKKKFKLGVLLLSCGMPVYRCVWNIYTRTIRNGYVVDE